MSSADYERVIEDMRLASGVPWALPVCRAVENEPTGDRIALADESGRLLAVLEVEEVYGYDKERRRRSAFAPRTTPIPASRASTASRITTPPEP